MPPFNALDVVHAIEVDRRKRAARTVIVKITADRARRLPLWWQWTAHLTAAITIRRIDAA